MIFEETALAGAFVIDLERQEDERGFFARTWCAHEFGARGLDTQLAQCNVSYTRLRGTIRGMHYQVSPAAEVKLVRCTRGAIYDVIVDLRRKSPTYRQWFAVVLSSENHRMLYVPKDFAHGYQTLTDDTEVAYQMSEVYAPEYARGFRWDDAAFGIRWPEAVRMLSDRDRTYDDFVER